MARLESAIDVGYATLYWSELYRWYGVEKIAAGTYRDIADRFAELAKQYQRDHPKRHKPGLELSAIHLDNGVHIFPKGYIEKFFEEPLLKKL